MGGSQLNTCGFGAPAALLQCAVNENNKSCDGDLFNNAELI